MREKGSAKSKLVEVGVLGGMEEEEGERAGKRLKGSTGVWEGIGLVRDMETGGRVKEEEEVEESGEEDLGIEEEEGVANSSFVRLRGSAETVWMLSGLRGTGGGASEMEEEGEGEGWEGTSIASKLRARGT